MRLINATAVGSKAGWDNVNSIIWFACVESLRVQCPYATFVRSPPGPSVDRFWALSAVPLCCVLGQYTLLSQCLSPRRCVNGCMRIYAGVTQRWISISSTGGGGGGGGVEILLVTFMLQKPGLLSIKLNRPVRDQQEYPREVERHFPIKPCQSVGMALATSLFLFRIP